MIHICFNLDDKYIPYLKILIRNITDKTNEECTFHIIGINECDIQTNHKCIFYPNPDLSWFKEDSLKSYWWINEAALWRLLIPYLIQEDKAIYLDIDLLIRFDIKELWDIDVDFVGAIPDYHGHHWGKEMGLESDIYYNSGVQIINLKNIRENMPDLKECILKAQDKYHLTIVDQDIFNGIYQGKIKQLPHEYNMFIWYQDILGVDNPKIVHCMGKGKYWNSEGLPYQDEWNNYAKGII